MRLLVFSFITFCISLSSVASTIHEGGLWLGYFNRHDVNETDSIHMEAQLRENFSQGKMNQSLLRFGMIKKLNERNSIGALFAYADSDTIKEYRPTLQHQFQYNEYLGLRQRLEYRNIEDNDTDSWRYRINLRFANIKITDKTQLVLWNEFFLNLDKTKWSGARHAERNRAFVGQRHQFKNFDLEWGYLAQYIPRKKQNTSEHLLVGYFIF